MSSAGNSQFLKFPFRVDSGGPQTSSRAEHVREQIEQLLYTSPQERVFRPEFGVGIRRLVFEPNGSALWNITRQQLTTSLAQALAGEVDPKTLAVELEQEENSLIIRISYRLAAINQDESYLFEVAGQAHG
jgi:hypothetical protein